MANSIKTQIKQDFQQVKTQSGQRISRIGTIIRDATTQTIAEVKQGSSEVQGIAKDSFSTVVENFTDETAESNTTDTKLNKIMRKAFVVIRTRLSILFKNQAKKVDTELMDRYGERYQTGKERLGKGLNVIADRLTGRQPRL